MLHKKTLDGKSYHWQLDVTFREDATHTIDKYMAYNLNIM